MIWWHLIKRLMTPMTSRFCRSCSSRSFAYGTPLDSPVVLDTMVLRGGGAPLGTPTTAAVPEHCDEQHKTRKTVTCSAGA